MSAEKYPLAWPEGWPRRKQQKRSAFKAGSAKTWNELNAEIAKIGGTYAVVSSNLPILADGTPHLGKNPIDTGVAVYFMRKGKQMVFACDTYEEVLENMRAISLTIAALRQIERHGASDMMERAFKGFTALEAGDPIRAWHEVLGFPKSAPVDAWMIEMKYKQLAKERHPDTGGSDKAFQELAKAREDALQAVGGKE